jgi:hypothetical protein
MTKEVRFDILCNYNYLLLTFQNRAVFTFLAADDKTLNHYLFITSLVSQHRTLAPPQASFSRHAPYVQINQCVEAMSVK